MGGEVDQDGCQESLGLLQPESQGTAALICLKIWCCRGLEQNSNPGHCFRGLHSTVAKVLSGSVPILQVGETEAE